MGLFMKSGDAWLQRKPARGIAGQRIRAVTSSISRLRYKKLPTVFRHTPFVYQSCINIIKSLHA